MIVRDWCAIYQKIGVLAVWQNGETVLYGVSNYESVVSRDELEEGADVVTVTECRSTPTNRLRMVATGAPPRWTDFKLIPGVIMKGNLNRAKALAVKAIKNVAYAAKAKGLVGAACQWANAA